MKEDFSIFFSGQKLYGDDFGREQIEDWFKDEQEGYANLGAKRKAEYTYGYNALNAFHGFRHLDNRHFDNVLGIGSAYGDEFFPILGRCGHVTILDPSDAFSGHTDIRGTPCSFRKPNINGDIEFPDDHFDLVSSLGVMHHIPNVTHVINECYRCMKETGVMILREPIVSMGDWRHPRAGLTRRERGIPRQILTNIINNAGFKIKNESLCVFPLVPRLSKKIRMPAYNNDFMTRADSILSRIFSWNILYHRTIWYQKFAPASVFYVLEK